jgi:hypothetical protein
MKTKSASAVILSALAGADILYLVSTVMTWIVYSWSEVLGELCAYMENFTLAIPFLMGFYETACDIVVWVFVMLVIERYVAMTYFIMKDEKCARHGLTGGTVVVAVSFLLATSFNVPALASYHIISKTVEENGTSVVVVPVGLSTMDNVSYSYYTLDCIINIFIPIILVTFMIVHNLFVKSRKGQQPEYTFAQREDGEPKVDEGAFATSAVIVGGFMFIICETPRVIETSLVLAQTDIQEQVFLDILHYCSLAFIMLQALNSFVKLFVYCMVSEKFKTTARSLYSRRRHRHGEQQSRSVGFSASSHRQRPEEEQAMVESNVDSETTKV